VTVLCRADAPEDVPAPLAVLAVACDPPQYEQALHGLRPQQVVRILYMTRSDSECCMDKATSLQQNRAMPYQH